MRGRGGFLLVGIAICAVIIGLSWAAELCFLPSHLPLQGGTRALEKSYTMIRLSSSVSAPRSTSGWAIVPALGAFLVMTRFKAPPHKRVPRQQEGTETTANGTPFNEVDVEGMLAESTFPIAPQDLISRCKEVLKSGGLRTGTGTDLAEDFEFCAPVVGPLTKDKYLEALGTFKLEEAFDTKVNYHFFQVDPFEPHRVWFFTRKTAVHVGEFMGKSATGKSLQFPPEVYSLAFNEDGKVKEFTVGYVVNRRVGNTGGLGGAFGYFYGIGNALPFPEGKPYKPSLQFRFFNWLARTMGTVMGRKVARK